MSLLVYGAAACTTFEPPVYFADRTAIMQASEEVTSQCFLYIRQRHDLYTFKEIS